MITVLLHILKENEHARYQMLQHEIMIKDFTDLFSSLQRSSKSLEFFQVDEGTADFAVCKQIRPFQADKGRNGFQKRSSINEVLPVFQNHNVSGCSIQSSRQSCVLQAGAHFQTLHNLRLLRR